jgi:hypothetical protein
MTLREEHKLRVFENRVLRKIFGPWRKLHNEELHNPYTSPSMIKSSMMRRAGNAARIGQKRNSRKPEGK